jgi:selenocysteine lyase/cysteine desulfurase
MRCAVFDDFGGRVWLNAAHQGPLPLAAAEEAQEAIRWKLNPSELTAARFAGVPQRVREAAASLINASPDEIALANSNSYGIHMIARAYPWREGDEVIVMSGDFPSDILPWLWLERERGVRVHRIQPVQHVISADELARAITPRTRLLCTTWVHSFSGWGIDLEALGEICRSRGVTFLLNASQAIGARVLDAPASPVDAVSTVGFKWLCGPYGTGFCWVSPNLRDRLRPMKAYWLAQQTAEDLGKTIADPELREVAGMRAFDIFGTANFFNYKPWAASIETILAAGVANIEQHDQALVDQLVAGLDQRGYEVLSPRAPGVQRSTLVLFAHRDAARNASIYDHLKRESIDLAFRGGQLRAAPHLYNSNADIDRLLEALPND